MMDPNTSYAVNLMIGGLIVAITSAAGSELIMWRGRKPGIVGSWFCGALWILKVISLAVLVCGLLYLIFLGARW